MELLLIRHCASTGQAPEAPLSEDGERQAFRLAHALAGLGIDQIISSPYERARATVRPLAIKLKLPIAVDERLREKLLSPEPLPDWLDHVRRSFADEDYRLPGGESLAEARERGLAAISDAVSGMNARPALASHGNLIAAILHAIDPAFGFDGWQSLANPDVFRLTTRNGVPIAFDRIALPPLAPETGKTP